MSTSRSKHSKQTQQANDHNINDEIFIDLFKTLNCPTFVADFVAVLCAQKPDGRCVTENLFEDLAVRTLGRPSFHKDFAAVLQSDVQAPLVSPGGADARSSKLFCRKCGKEEVSCFCDELYCRRCLLLATRCGCVQPWVKINVCTECTAPEPSSNSIDSAAFLPTPYAEALTCLECGNEHFREPDGPDDPPLEYYTLSGSYECHECGRVDAQDLIFSCDGSGCSSMLHGSCMPTDQKGNILCSACAESGKLPSEFGEGEEEE